MYYYLSESQLQNIVNNAISYGTNKLDERYTLLNKLIKEVKIQELEETEQEIQTESKKSVLIKDLPSNIKSYSLGKITKENVFLPRKAAMLVQKAGKFSSKITLEYGNRKANAKSLMGVLSLGAKVDSSIILKIEGADEKEAMENIDGFFTQSAS